MKAEIIEKSHNNCLIKVSLEDFFNEQEPLKISLPLDYILNVAAKIKKSDLERVLKI